MFRVAQERGEDVDEVEALLDLAFAPGRLALSSYRLRDGVDRVAELCLLARDEFDVVVGAIRFWPIVIGEMTAEALLLGPIAVHPTRQAEGLGALLMSESLGRAAEHGWTRVVLIGDEPYYKRFGFTRALGRALDYPPPTNPDRLLARALAPNAFEGVRGMVRRWPTSAADGAIPGRKSP